MHLRTRLLLLVYAVLVPAFAAGALAVWFVYAEQRQAQDKGLREAARATALLVDKELERTVTLLQVLANSPSLQAGDLAAFRHHAHELAPTSDTTLVVSDVAGQQLVNTRRPLGSDLPAVNDGIQGVRRAAGERAVIVSDLFRARFVPRYEISVQVPVFVDGRIRYYLSRSMAADALSGFLQAHGFPPSWIVSVADRRGIVIARTEAAERFVGKPATGSIADKLRTGTPSGMIEGRTLDGRTVTAYFHRAPLSQWTVVLSVPADELRAPAANAALLLTVLMLAILAVAFAAARRYARLTTAPVLALQEDAARLGRGEPIARQALPIVELDALNAALVDASGRLRESTDDLERRVREAVDKAEQAQRALLQAQKLEALGRLTGGIAHDFNNVLQTLTMSLQLMRIERQPDRLQERIGLCERAIERATALIGQLRAFGRVHEVNLETIPTAEAIEAILPMLVNAVPPTIRVERVCSPRLWPITVDPVQFEMALLNLVMNARDAMPDGGTVSVRAANRTMQPSATAAAAGEYVCISVTDSGVGMPPDVLDKAFEPFFTTKAVDRGTGLGLAQVYGFAAQAGGTVTIESGIGVGTSVTLFLPAAREQEAVPFRRQATEPERRLAGSVLFVEDEVLVRESVVPFLVRAGLEVATAPSGDAALALLQEGMQFDAVFTDIVMPGQTGGIALARWLHRHRPGTGIVLATGYAGEPVDIPGVRLLPKPYSTADALDALAAALAGTAQRQPVPPA